MNLVQINERLKDLPMQVIQQYANGMNPEIPPYLALGELQRRERTQQQMATAQGAAGGPQPSVKEQVEQKAGLMAAQGLQQQQMMQQMQQPRGPMPVPAGVPQPESQPQSTMMARGGLAGAPVNFNFQHGGIVAFEEGGKTSKYETRADKLYRENREAEERRKREFDMFNAQISDDPAQVKMREAQKAFEAMSPAERSSERGQQLKQFLKDVVMAPPAAILQAPMAAPMRPAAPISRPTSQITPQQMESQVKPPAPIADLKALADQKQRQQGPRPMPAAAPQTAPAGQESELARLSMEAMRNPAKAMTPEEAMAQEGKMAAGYGLNKPFGEEERGLLAAMKQRQAQQAERRPMAELGATLRGFGQGYGGAGAAGERAGQETFNVDMAHQREMLNAINALNKTNLETGKERYKAGSGLFSKSQESTAAANRERMQSLGTAATAEANRKTQERGQDIQVQVAKIQAAATQAARAQGADDKTVAAAEAAFARDPEAKALSKVLEMVATNPDNPRYQTTLQKLQAIQASKYRQFGIKLEGAPGAPKSPGGIPADVQALLKQYPGGK